jgi:hypothetical protein
VDLNRTVNASSDSGQSELSHAELHCSLCVHCVLDRGYRRDLSPPFQSRLQEGCRTANCWKSLTDLESADLLIDGVIA